MSEQARRLEPGAQAAARGVPLATPIARFDAWLTRFESTLCAVILVLEILALCFWVTLKGLASTSAGGDLSGAVLRGLLTSIVLGVGAHLATRPRPGEDRDRADKRHALVTTVATLAGLALGRAWVGVGSGYFSNLLNWYQNASLLMLVGGLSGLATRLTLWVALLGGSIATAKGKHINVDVVMRFLPERFRVSVAILGWLVGAVMCTAAAWGFVDFIAVASFKLPTAVRCEGDPEKTCPMPASRELRMLSEEVGRDLFLVRRQASLDSRSFPRVILGSDYNAILTNAEWNRWLESANWEEHFEKEDVERLKAPEESGGAFHTPAVGVPGGDEGARGLLIRDFDFVFPFGLLMIALRFLVRSVLAATGHVRVDPDAMHDEEDLPSQEEDDRRAASIASGGLS